MATSSGSWNGGEQIDEEMPEFLRIPPSDIQIGVQIGRGGFSTVHKALWRSMHCAAKVVRTANVLVMQREVAILSKLRHPNIAVCLGFSVDTSRDPNRCMILMELMESDLRHLMDKRLKMKFRKTWPFKETEAVDILCQIAAGMEFLHGQGVFHGDLKASNVLVSHDRDGKLHVKITDFGVSQMVKLNPEEKSEDFMRKKHFRGVVGTRGYQAPEVSSSILGYQTGTTQYRAPEIFRIHSLYPGKKSEEFYTAKADVYCFAMTCYEIFSGRIPFESVKNADIPGLVMRGARPVLPRGLHRQLEDIVEICWDLKPSKRPRFSDITYSLERWSKDRKSQERGFENQDLQERGSKDQSCKKAPECWGRLLKWSICGPR